MFEESDVLRLKFVLEMIETIHFICERHGSVANALSDKEGQPAIFMCFLQIGETLRKLKSEQLIQLLPVSAAYTMRNVISHDYLGVDLSIVESTIQNDIPDLENQVKRLVAQGGTK